MPRQRPQKPLRGLHEKPIKHASTPAASGDIDGSGHSTGIDGLGDLRQSLRRSGSRGAKLATEDTSASLSGRHSASSPNTIPTQARDGEEDMENLSRKSQWIVLAIASGGCAAFNGVFAKLYVVLSSFAGCCCARCIELPLLFGTAFYQLDWFCDRRIVKTLSRGFRCSS